MPHIGDMLAEMLAQYEVEYVFGMPGGQTTALHDGISRRPDRIRHVLVRDERSAAYAADAYARLTNKPGVCDVTVGPGATKLVDGFVEASNASIPLIGIVGELPLDWLSLKPKGVASQGFDQLGMFKAIAKEAWLVPSVTALPELLRTAFRVATSPRPGPVALLIPHDIMDQPWNERSMPVHIDTRYSHYPAHRSVPVQEEIDAAAAVIKKARRPAIVCGGGVFASEAGEQVTEFADKVQGLVVTSLSGKGSVPESRDYNAGVLNPLGEKAALDAVREADLLIWCGSKASQNTSLNWTLPLPEQATITIDFDPEEHGRTFKPTVSLCGDVRETVKLLSNALPQQKHPTWVKKIVSHKKSAESLKIKDRQSDAVPISPPRVMQEVARHLKDDDVVISDASFSAGWISGHIPANIARRRFLYFRGQGGLGVSTPAAIGAGLVRPKSTIVTVAGDGGFSFAIGELPTQVLNGLKVVNIVLNNGSLGWIQMWQEIFFQKVVSTRMESNMATPKYAEAGAALGLEGFYVDDPAKIAETIAAAFAHDGCSVVEIRTDDQMTPLHSFKRRKDSKKKPALPGTVYSLRDWKISPKRGK
ncbi:MAG: thiamine pyrophosphate-binding protein [Granulosicoccus sp.]